MSLVLHWAGRSETGPVREGNEDSGYAGPRLALIADGVGGMIAGEVASAITLGAMRRLDDDAADDVLDALSTALTGANTRLREAVAADPALEGMGTTLTALLSNGTQLGLAHVGDSRAYLLRDGRLQQVSTDHTFVQTLVDEGRITAEEARTHPHKSLILQALDGRTRIDPDLLRLDLTAGDRYLLCSDGLSDVLRDEDLVVELAVPDTQAAADGLVEAALRGGASDNVTCLVVDAVETADAVQVDGATPLVLGAAANPAVTGLVERLTARSPDAAAGPGGPIGGRVDSRSGSGAAAGSGQPDDPEELRYAPREPHRLRWLARSLATVGVLALLAAGGDFAYGWTQTQYFVTDHGGRVAIYRGIPQHVPGLDLAHLYWVSDDLPVDALPEFFRHKVVDEAVTADDLTQAQAIVANLAGLAVRCGPTPTRGTRATVTAVPTPAPRPAAPRPGTPAVTQRPSAPAARPATPAASPSATAQPRECTGGTDLASSSAGPLSAVPTATSIAGSRIGAPTAQPQPSGPVATRVPSTVAAAGRVAGVTSTGAPRRPASASAAANPSTPPAPTWSPTHGQARSPSPTDGPAGTTP